MKKSDISSKLREFSKTLSPRDSERMFINDIYASLCALFGDKNCIQIGSYPRFTATTPVHDLDVLYCIDEWAENIHEPEDALIGARDMIRQNYDCPSGYMITTELQNHSVVMEFINQADNVKLSVDIVPCYSFGVNVYGDSMYKVPHVIKIKDRTKRRQNMWNPSDTSQWISSDPRGYISQATEVGKNNDFRKVVKIVKHWKRTLRNIDDDLKLKSFHLEQVITNQFRNNLDIDIADAIFNFFIDLPEILSKPNQIEDRAQPGKFIDDYIIDLTDRNLADILKARNNLLILLENISDETLIEDVFTAKLYDRNPDEKFMFDYQIPVYVDSYSVAADIRCDDYASRGKLRRSTHRTDEEKLYFKLKNGISSGYHYFWKVKNSDSLDTSKRRGEITENQTKNYPETTKYAGLHYVECFAVNERGICEARAKHEVEIRENA